MKKTISTLLMAGLITLQAGEYKDNIGGNDIYVKGEIVSLSGSTGKILKVIPAKELLGEDSKMYKVSVGIESQNETFKGSEIGFYVGKVTDFDTQVEGGDSEITYGMEFEASMSQWHFLDGKVKPFIGGRVGLGSRGDKGSVQHVSAYTNVASYVTTPNVEDLKEGTARDLVLVKDSDFFELEYEVGVKVDVTKDLKVKLSVGQSSKKYDIYVDGENQMVENLFGNSEEIFSVTKENLNLGIGVSYSF
jgi:hypothetical protein